MRWLLVVSLLSLTACHRSARHAQARGGPGISGNHARVIALGATVRQDFATTEEGCLSGGSGKLDLRIHCIPNFGALTVDDVAVDDPSVIELAAVQLPAGPQPGPSFTLRALRVGKTVLHARARVGLTVDRFAIPLEVVVPDRVTLDERLDEPMLAGSQVTVTPRAFSGGREVETGELDVITREGAGHVDGRVLRTAPDRGGTGVIRSRFDPTLAVPYTVVTERELEVALDVLPTPDCRALRLVPRFRAAGRPLALRKDPHRGDDRGLVAHLFTVTPETCELSAQRLNQVPVAVGEEGGVLRLTGRGACRVQVGLRTLPRAAGVHALAERGVAPPPCAR